MEEYRDVPFDLVHYIIPNYFFLDHDFSICYRFLMFPPPGTDTNERRLVMIEAANPDVPSFDTYYSAEYDMEHNKLFIHFQDDKFEVASFKVHSGGSNAMVLHLTDPEARSHFFYSASVEPFDPRHRQLYGR
jgi:hypothetical protein